MMDEDVLIQAHTEWNECWTHRRRTFCRPGATQGRLHFAAWAGSNGAAVYFMRGCDMRGARLTNASRPIRPSSHSVHSCPGSGPFLYFLCYNVATVLS